MSAAREQPRREREPLFAHDDSLADTIRDAVADAFGDTHAVRVAVADGVALAIRDSVRDAVAQRVRDAVRDAQSIPERVTLPVRITERDRFPLAIERAAAERNPKWNPDARVPAPEDALPLG